MESVEERRNTTLIRRREMHSMQKTSTRYAKLTNNNNGSLKATPDSDKSQEEVLEEHGIRIVDSNVRNFSNISPSQVAEYYKDLGVWQDVLPKTDYTYSPVSAYNKKKINGIYPVIPNMSRRSLWKGGDITNSEIVDNRINSIYAERYSILNSKRWYMRDEESEKRYHPSPQYSSGVLNMRQWISNKGSSVIHSSAMMYWRWQSYLMKMRSEVWWRRSSLFSSFSSSSASSRSWMKTLSQYVFPFLVSVLLCYFFLWSPSDHIYEARNVMYSSISRVVESLSSLVFNFIDFTLASVTFILSSLKSVPNLMEEFRVFVTPKERPVDVGNVHLDSRQMEEVFSRLLRSMEPELARKIVNSAELSDFLNEKLKSLDERNTKNYESLIREKTNLEERLKSLELQMSDSRMSEQVEELRAQIQELREEIRTKETKIESDFFVLMSTILSAEPGQGIDDIKTKFVALFRSIEEAHFKIDKLDREFSNYLNNASDRIEIMVGRSSERVKLDLKSFMEELTTRNLEEWKRSQRYDFKVADVGSLEKYVKEVVQKALDIYDADKTGMTDYALESSGGIVLSTRCTETKKSSAQFSILGIPFWQTSRSPRTVIQPGVHPGECWAFPGSTGYLVIQLSENIFITGVSLEHIPKAIAPNRTIDSAPKDFSVWALQSETDAEGKLLGKFRYDDDGPSVQYYEVVPLDKPYQVVELKILSNHGKIDYTCLYRFRVHGIPA